MYAHNEKLGNANVVAVFEVQDDAEEAVLGLRVAGFADEEIGYFSRDQAGLVTDFAGSGHTLSGMVIGTFLGVLIGAWMGQEAIATKATHIGPAIMSGASGVILTCAICGAVLLGMTGALIGWGIPSSDAVHLGDEIASGRYVVAVNAGDRSSEAWAIMTTHGGHEPMPHDAVLAL